MLSSPVYHTLVTHHVITHSSITFTFHTKQRYAPYIVLHHLPASDIGGDCSNHISSI